MWAPGRSSPAPSSPRRTAPSRVARTDHSSRRGPAPARALPHSPVRGPVGTRAAGTAHTLDPRTHATTRKSSTRPAYCHCAYWHESARALLWERTLKSGTGHSQVQVTRSNGLTRLSREIRNLPKAKREWIVRLFEQGARCSRVSDRIKILFESNQFSSKGTSKVVALWATYAIRKMMMLNLLPRLLAQYWGCELKLTLTLKGYRGRRLRPPLWLTRALINNKRWGEGVSVPATQRWVRTFIALRNEALSKLRTTTRILLKTLLYVDPKHRLQISMVHVYTNFKWCKIAFSIFGKIPDKIQSLTVREQEYTKYITIK